MSTLRRLGWGAFAVAMLLSGCGLSSTNVLFSQATQSRQVDPTGLTAVKAALASMSSIETYQMKGQIQVATGRFVRTTDFYGTVQLPDVINMDETIGGTDYVLYQNGSFSYYRDGNRWVPSPPIANLKPWDSLTRLVQEDPPKVVYSLPEQTVTSWLCRVYQFKSEAKGADFTAIGNKAGLHTIAHSALYTVWIDANDGQLRQVEVQSTVGIPDLGTASIDATQLYFGYNQKMNLTVPSDLLAQVERP